MLDVFRQSIYNESLQKLKELKKLYGEIEIDVFSMYPVEVETVVVYGRSNFMIDLLDKVLEERVRRFLCRRRDVLTNQRLFLPLYVWKLLERKRKYLF